MNENELFLQRLGFLQDFVSNAEQQLGICEALRETTDQPDTTIQSAIFLTILPGVEQRLILYCAQLLDQKSGTNLKKLITHYRENRDKIDHAGNPVSNQVIEELLETSHLNDAKIRTLRDRAIAHLDRAYTTDPATFLEENKVHLQDVVSVIQHAQRILSCLGFATKKSSIVSTGGLFRAATLQYFCQLQTPK